MPLRRKTTRTFLAAAVAAAAAGNFASVDAAANGNFCMDGHCYFLQTNRANAADAEAVCQSLDSNGHVAVPTNSTFELMDEAIHDSGLDEAWFIGVTSLGNCSWVAFDGSDVDVESFWYSGEPNGCATCTGDLDDTPNRECCAEVQHWGPPFPEDGINDIPCWSEHPYFCQIPCSGACDGTITPYPTTTTTTTTRPAAENNFCLDGTCYFIQTQEATAKRAEEVCQSLNGGHIALPKNHTVLNMIDAALKNTGITGEWWVGTFTADSCNWTSLTTLDTPEYLDWYDGEPNGCESCAAQWEGNGVPECCAHVAHWGPPHAARGYNDVHCLDTAPYVCAVPCTGDCSGTPTQFPTTTTIAPDTTTSVTTTTTTTTEPIDYSTVTFCTEGSCFYVRPGERTLQDAEAICQSAGGHVASPDNPDVMMQLDDAMQNVGITGDYWVGLYAEAGCNWTRVDGFAPTTYDWYPNEPNGCDGCSGDFDSSDNVECCALTTHWGEPYAEVGWNDVGCGTKVPFACGIPCTAGDCSSMPSEFPAPETTASPTTTTLVQVDVNTEPAYCAGPVCYYVQTQAAPAWQAGSVCHSIGGHMAAPFSLSSFMDMDAAMNASGVTGEYWVGLFAVDGCTWTNELGIVANYTDWYPSEPNGCSGCSQLFDEADDAECCAHATHWGEPYPPAGWNDLACSQAVPYMCVVTCGEGGCPGMQTVATTEDAGNLVGPLPSTGSDVGPEVIGGVVGGIVVVVIIIVVVAVLLSKKKRRMSEYDPSRNRTVSTHSSRPTTAIKKAASDPGTDV